MPRRASGQQETIKLGNGHISEIKFSPDGRLLATLSEKGRIVAVFEWSTLQKLHETKLSDGALELTFSPDSRTLAIAEHRIVSSSTKHHRDRAFVLWDLTDPARKRFAETPQHLDHITTIEFSPDGQQIVGTAVLRNTADWKSEDELFFIVWDNSTSPRILIQRQIKNTVSDLFFLPDGSRIVTCQQEHGIRVWDPATLTPLFSLDSHDRKVCPGGSIGEDKLTFDPFREAVIASTFTSEILVFSSR